MRSMMMNVKKNSFVGLRDMRGWLGWWRYL